MLPDLLAPDLQLVICGTGAGARSAEVGEFYAGRGNRFWRTLAEVGLTPNEFVSAQYPKLLGCGIGLTDLVKDQAGADSRLRVLPRHQLSLWAKILLYQPRYLCFNGKRAAREFLGTNSVEYGIQAIRVGSTTLFVAPSTSTAANGPWDLDIWRDLSRRAGRSGPPKRKRAR